MRIHIPQEDLRYIFATALHDGIGYWAGKCKNLQVASDGNPVLAVFPNKFTQEEHLADISTIRRGIGHYLAHIVRGGINGHHLSRLKGIGIRGIDIEGADLILQYGLFSEIRYQR